MYSYTPKGDHFTIFKGKKKLHTPNGNVVIAYDEDLAKKVIAALEAEEDYTSPSSLLCYHFTYCDLIAQYDSATIHQDLVTCCNDNLEDDPFFMFGHEEEDYEEVYSQTRSELLSFIKKASISQMVAMIVLYCSFDSLVLATCITRALVGCDDQSDEFASKVDTLIKELRAYCKDEDFSLPKSMPDIIIAYLDYSKC